MGFQAEHQAKIIIIGGGVLGCAVAYHLTRLGERDVLLLEKGQLTDGCTWHAAGLVGQLRGKRNLTRLMQNSVRLFERLAEETGVATDWNQVGSLRLASSEDRWSEIRRAMTQARSFGFECHGLSAAEAERHFPFIDRRGVVGATFIPSDGYIDPTGLTQALARGARQGGATFREGICVTDIVTSGRRVVGIVTNAGTIACDLVVNCAGLWARRIGEMAGVKLAAGVVEHQYFITEKGLPLKPDLPTLRDPDKNFYLKPEVGAFAIGGWEKGTKACWNSRPPLDFGRSLFDANMERLERFALPAMERLPVLQETGIHTVINGPIPVSADGEPIMGLAPELDNFYVACGFTAGIAASGGAGEAMANWIVHGDPGMDLWAFDVRRFGAPHNVDRFLEERIITSYAHYYEIHWPGEDASAPRGVRRSPLYDRLKARGAVHGSKFGWERPNWFTVSDASASGRASFEGKPGWFSAVAAEHRAVREGVALIDQTSFSSFEISGPGAFDFLQGLAVARISEQPGRCTYTQLCNAKGGIEADLTIMHVDKNRFHVVTGSGFGVHDGQWIRAHMPPDGSVHMHETTACTAVINLCGPRARDVLSKVTSADVSNAALPFLGVRTLDIGHAPVLAARIGYVGELGWELHVPMEYAAALYDELRQAGENHGIADVGYLAIDSLRLEKGYLYWSADITPDYTPYEAGLGFCVDLGKGDFIGRDALKAQKEKGLTRRLRTLTVKGFAPFHGGEAVVHEGRVISLTTSAGFGHTIGQSIAMAYLPADLSDEAPLEIEAFGQRYAARQHHRTLYDPQMQRLRM